MPTLIDTHVHLSPTRDALIRDLRLRAYYGVSAALSLGTDRYDVLDLRGQAIPGAARFFSAGRGITMPKPGRTTVRAPRHRAPLRSRGREGPHSCRRRRAGARHCDKDIDDELIAMFKQRPTLILTPNLPDRGVKVDLSWLGAGRCSTPIRSTTSRTRDASRR